MTISDKDADLIFTMKELGATWKRIALKLGKSESAVRKYHQRKSALLELPPKIKISKLLTDGRVGLKIKSIVKENPMMSVRDIEVELRKSIDQNTPTPKKSSISNYLLKNNLQVIKLLKKPLISPRNIERRLAFALIHLQDPDLLESETIWSDETTVRKMPKDKDLHYRVHGSLLKENLPYNHQIQMGGFSVMFWGCFSSCGLGPLVALEGFQNQHTYLKLLQDYLLHEIQVAQQVHGIDFTFMQDNAPCHKTNLIMDFLRQNNVPTLDWPAQSPDLNPIENLWSIIKRRRQKKFGIPHTKVELVEQIFHIWEGIDGELLDTLSESITNRLREVVRLKGRATKY
jgi:hypothetical protein